MSLSTEISQDPRHQDEFPPAESPDGAARRPADPFLVDADGLRALASEPVVQRGVNYFKEHRVTELGWEEEVLRANVEGSDPDLPYVVQIEEGPGGELEVTCSCPYDWEPVCKHAVATLLAYAARQPVSAEQVASAARGAVEERVRKGTTEVTVKHVSGAAEFGTWVARSITPTGGIPREYRVQIRSTSERLNRCSCLDFATNQLGTCKHIEAVLHKLDKRRRHRGRRSAAALGVPVVYLAWDVPSAPRIRVRRPDRCPPELDELLVHHFDDEGFLRGQLPEALTRFERDAAARFDVDLGDDARDHALRVGEQAAQRERAQRVRRAIQRSGGQLPGVRARLYPYQVEGVAFLAATGRALLADDMGLGKTLQAIAAAVWLRRNEGVERMLVVCPASLKHQWAREVRRFSELDVEVIQGGLRAREAQYRRRRPVTVVNYELVLRDHAAIALHLAPDLLVLDEAQRIKNWRTKTATAVKALQSRYAFVLSGTPLENRLDDLYSVMQVVDPRVLGPLWRFMIDFHVTDERGKALGYRNLSELRRRLAPVMLRRDRRLVEDQLPPRVEQRLDVPLTSTQRELHDQAMMSASIIGDIAKRRPLTPSEEKRLLAALQQARMACNAAGLVDGKTEGSPKLTELRKLLEELCVDGGNKVVVFSQWERMTRMAKRVAEELNLGVVRLHGGVPTKKRGALIARFERDPERQVFLSTDAGGVGLNLQAASVLINLDLPWNPAVLDQRIGRVHRLGQKRTVQAILLVAVNAYEERMLVTLGGKRQLFANVIEDGGEDVVGLSKRMVEMAMETLGRDEDGEPATEDDLAAAGSGMLPDVSPVDEPPGDAAALAAGGDDRPAPGPSPQLRPRDDGAATRVVERLQREIGERLERVLVAQSGLLAVVDQLDGAFHDLARELSRDVPVAIVDQATYEALQRLGAGTPAGAAEELWTREEEGTAAPAPHPLERQARRKLEAAEALMASECAAEAAGLLAVSMLGALALRAGRDTAPDVGGAAIWLFGEAVPGGLVMSDDAALVLRADALSRADAPPVELTRELLVDARRIVLGAETDCP